MLKLTRISILAACVLCIAFIIGMFATATHAQDSTPTFGDVTVALDYSHTTLKPIDSLETYPAGIKGIVAVVPVQNMIADSEMDAQWYRNGHPAVNIAKATINAGDGIVAAKMTNTGGLVSGDWEIRFRYQGQVVAKTTFKVQDVPMAFLLKFGDDHSEIGMELINPRTSFPSESVNISAVFQYMNIPIGTTLEGQWFLDDKPFSTSKLQITDPAGKGVFNISKADGLADGTYELKIVMKGNVIQSGKVTVGSGK